MYTIGIDYGTLSGRAILADQNGKELATCAYDYPHAVMDQTLPDGTPLGQDWALQHPQDYLDVLDNTIPQLLRESGVNPAQIVGIGVDFTACTILPVKRDGTPLCFLEAYRSQPHAYVKLWKHHSAQKYANLLNDIARERGETFLERYGGKISSEWQIPKIWQIVEEAPQIYDQADFILEAGDWIVWQLTAGIRAAPVPAATRPCGTSGMDIPPLPFLKLSIPSWNIWWRRNLPVPSPLWGKRRES